MPSFEENFFTQRDEICSQETVETLCYHTVKTRCRYLI